MLTGRRLGFVVAGLLAIGLGLLAQWPEVFGIGLAVALLPFIVGRGREPRGLGWRDVSVPVRATRGDPLEVIIAIDTDGTTPLTTVSAVDGTTGRREWLDIDPDGVAEVVWPVDTSRRGVGVAGPDRLEIADPFGLSARVIARRQQPPVLIGPRVHPVDITLALRHGAETTWQGMRTVESPQAGGRGVEEFHSLREYTAGDSLRLIHWRASARVGSPVIRTMTDSDTPRLLIILDTDPLSYGRATDLFPQFTPAAFEAAVDLCASWVWWGAAWVDEVILTTAALDRDALTVAAAQREPALDLLALVEPNPSAPLTPETVHRLADLLGAATITVVTGPTGGRVLPTAAGRRHAPVHRAIAHPPASPAATGGPAAGASTPPRVEVDAPTAVPVPA